MVEREKVRKFGPGMSVEECEAERKIRLEAVRESGFRTWLNWWGSEGEEGWSSEVKEAVRRLRNGGEWMFGAGETGFEIKE